MPPRDAEHDREVVAAITAGDPTGIAMAYDSYGAALYGYCHWVLHDSADAAESLQDTFVVAAATLSELPEPSKLRPSLFALARNECRRRIRPASATRDEVDAANQQSGEVGRPTDAADAVRESADATMPFRVVSEPADATMPFRVVSESAHATDGLADVNGYLGQAELRTLIRSLLADIKPREREVIELSFRHDLDDDDLAIALGVSGSRAHALASRAHSRLEKSFGVLRTALAGREACPVAGELLAAWDGQLTEQTRDLVVWHIEQCQTCSNRAGGALRPTALSGLLPLAPLPPELREKVLSRCFSTSEDAVAYRRRVVRRAEATWATIFSQAIRRVSWDSIRANPGAAIAATAVAVWVVAAVSVTLLTFAGSHDAQAQVVQPSVQSSSSSPAAAAITATSPRTPAAAPRTKAAASAAARPFPTVSEPAYVPSQVQPSASPSHSSKPSKSPSPSHTTTPSPSSSPSPSVTA